MSKNLTRKGLAFGAVVALGTTLFAGAPAQAASVLFAPTTGTGNTLVAGETFSLTASLSSDLPAGNSTQLKFRVANTTGVAATVKINGNTISAVAAAATRLAGNGPVALDASVGGTTAASALAASTTSAVFGIGPAHAQDAAVVSGASVATNPTTISISSALNTAASYTVTAFLDANNNAVIDAGELSSAQTVNFVKVADAGATVTFTKPLLSSANLKATVAFAADINVAQLTAANYKVGFGVYTSAGQKTATGTAGAAIADANLIATSIATAGDKFLTATATAVNGPAGASALPVAGATYGAQAWSRAVDGATFAAIGTGVTQVVASAAAADNTALVVAPTISDNVIAGVTNTFGTTGVYSVRTGVTSTAVKTTVKLTPAGGTATAVGAGVPVTVTVSGLTLGTNSAGTVTDTLSVAGTAVTSANVSTFSVTVATAADGTVTVPVVAGYGHANTAITVTLRVPDAGSAATGSASLAWTPSAAPTFTRIAVGSTDLTVVKGGTIALQYALKDSYNALYAGSDYRLVVSAAGAGTSPTAAGNYFPVVNGIANVSFADNSTGAGTNVLTITREILANGIWGSSAAVAPVNVNVIAAAQTATAVTAAVDTAAAKGSDASKLLPLDVAGTYVSGNTATATNSVTAPSITAGSSTTISGVVTDASGVAVANASVKVELAGAQISSGTAYGIGSLTVAADNSGAYSVTVSTHTAGVQSVKVTSGAATKTVSLYVAAAASTTGTVLTIDAPATVVPGKTVTFTGKLVDKFGNPVATAVTANNATPDFKVVYAGPGFAAQTLPIDTDAAGSFTVSIVTGVADSGSAVLTATYGGSKGAIDATVTGATADITKSATVTIAAPVVVVPEVKTTIVGVTKALRVRVENAKGEEVEIVVNGRTVAVATAGTNSKLWVLKSTKGKKSVKVYVDGDLVAVKTVTVK